ncbi:hypothetical protein ACJX0J_016471, partial [Zea mays]
MPRAILEDWGFMFPLGTFVRGSIESGSASRDCILYPLWYGIPYKLADLFFLLSIFAIHVTHVAVFLSKLLEPLYMIEGILVILNRDNNNTATRVNSFVPNINAILGGVVV